MSSNHTRTHSHHQHHPHHRKETTGNTPTTTQQSIDPSDIIKTLFENDKNNDTTAILLLKTPCIWKPSHACNEIIDNLPVSPEAIASRKTITTRKHDSHSTIIVKPPTTTHIPVSIKSTIIDTTHDHDDDDNITIKTGYENTPISFEIALLWWFYKLNEIETGKLDTVINEYIDRISYKIREDRQTLLKNYDQRFRRGVDYDESGGALANHSRFIDPISNINDSKIAEKAVTNPAVFQKWVLFAEAINVNAIIIIPPNKTAEIIDVKTQYIIVNQQEYSESRKTIFVIYKNEHDYRPLRETARNMYNIDTIFAQPDNYVRWNLDHIVQRYLTSYSVAELTEFLASIGVDVTKMKTSTGRKPSKSQLLEKYITLCGIGSLLV